MKSIGGVEARSEPRVAICAIAKNEARYLDEWVAYHHLVGFDPIRIYSHEPDDDSNAVLERLAGHGLLEWTDWSVPAGKKPQWVAYEDGLDALRDRTEWVAFIDLDEFVVTPRHATIQEFLKYYGDLDAIAVNWKMFGSSGHVTREPGLVIERFTRCANKRYKGNRSVKTLARIDAIEVPLVHTCVFRPGVEYLTVSGQELAPDGLSREVSHETIRINHYFTRSREEWAEKAARGRGAKPAGHPLKHRQDDEFVRNDLNDDEETDIIRMAPAVKELIAKAGG